MPVPTIYTISPTNNLPDKTRYFVTCDKRDMQPYLCDSIIRDTLKDALWHAIRNAAQYGDTSIIIRYKTLGYVRGIEYNSRLHREANHEIRRLRLFLSSEYYSNPANRDQAYYDAELALKNAIFHKRLIRLPQKAPVFYRNLSKRK